MHYEIIMNDFNRCNKVTSVHWLKEPLKDVQIKVHLKSQDCILSLPKYEDYANDSNSGVNFQNLEANTEEYTFKWQEKIFSTWELQRYSDIHNCLSDAELNYCDMIQNIDCTPSKVFTYVHEDYHLPLPAGLEKERAREKVALNLNSCFERLNLGCIGKYVTRESSSMSHLFRSEENITAEEEQWTAMHIVFDNSEYNESQLLLKQEATLLSLYHNKRHNYVIVSPDVNDLQLNPYTLDGVGYEYGVEIQFGRGEGDELGLLLKKLHKKWVKKQKQLIGFVMPPLGRKLFYLSLEIVSATKFDMDNLYVEFHVKVKPPCLKLFCEVISTDWWGRHRTEGYSYIPLTLEPGEYEKHLSCSRPEELDSIVADSRRFFVGGCNLIKDFDVLEKPQLKETNFKLTTTGSLALRYHIIAQSHLPVPGIEPAPLAVSSSWALLRGAEAALAKYKRARERLAAATGLDSRVGDEGSGDG